MYISNAKSIQFVNTVESIKTGKMQLQFTVQYYDPDDYFSAARFDPGTPYFVHDGTVAFSCIYSGVNDPSKVEWFKVILSNYI